MTYDVTGAKSLLYASTTLTLYRPQYIMFLFRSCYNHCSTRKRNSFDYGWIATIARVEGWQMLRHSILITCRANVSMCMQQEYTVILRIATIDMILGLPQNYASYLKK